MVRKCFFFFNIRIFLAVTLETLITFLTIENNNPNDPSIKSGMDSINLQFMQCFSKIKLVTKSPQHIQFQCLKWVVMILAVFSLFVLSGDLLRLARCTQTNNVNLSFR